MTSPESRLKEIREKIADYWFVDNPNGFDVNDEIVWLCDQLDLANKRTEILREALHKYAELKMFGDVARESLKAADEVKL